MRNFHAGARSPGHSIATTDRSVSNLELRDRVKGWQSLLAHDNVPRHRTRIFCVECLIARLIGKLSVSAK